MLAVLLPGGGSQADEATFQITRESVATQVTFELGAVFHTVHGRGQVKEAHLTHTLATGELAGAIELPAATLTTDNRRRDSKMHQQVLKSTEYPLIRMILRRADGILNPATGGALQIEADLVLLGRPHPVSFPAEITILDVETGRLRATGAFSVPYVAWGLEDPSSIFLRVDKEVRVTFSAVGILALAPTP
jgi:hypothetical protein